MVSVLLIDDDPAISRLLRLVFLTEDMQFESAQSGAAALERLSNGHAQPDVIILDLNMPGMDGRQVFQEVRGMGVECPIVLCSAFGAARANMELGGQGAIEKPFEPEAVVASIRELVST